MKEVYIVRHAIAEDRIEFAKSGLLDSERPITEQGRHKMIKISEWLKHQIESDIDLIAYSPLVRSKQTCDILKKTINCKSVDLWDELEPSTQVLKLKNKIFNELELKNNIMLVGHEPQLTSLVQSLLSKAETTTNPIQNFFKLKKGGVVCITFKPEPVLKWFVTPKNILPLSL